MSHHAKVNVMAEPVHNPWVKTVCVLERSVQISGVFPVSAAYIYRISSSCFYIRLRGHKSELAMMVWPFPITIRAEEKVAIQE